MSQISVLLIEWYRSNGRDLPWRRTRDPYHIWLSEVILQQTRVAQGTDYYLRFVDRFPTVQALAAASQDEVLKLWQGLGYYSRARNLHEAAIDIEERFGGTFPTNYADVRSLKGVGDYTAAAICSLAYDAPYAVLDGNVFRVLSRLFEVDVPIDTSAGKRFFAELAQSQLDKESPATYNQAIMDFGALHCLPTQPRCEICPFVSQCLAYQNGKVTLLPIKQGKTAVRERWFNYLHLVCGEETLLTRRETKDIWQGLYEFPLIESDYALSLQELSQTAAYRELFGDMEEIRVTNVSVMPKHQLSHQTIHAVYYRIETACWTPVMAMFRRVHVDKLGEYAVSRLTERYLLKQTLIENGYFESR